MTRRLRWRYGASYTEGLWRDACGSGLWRRLLKRCAAMPMEPLWGCLRTRSGANKRNDCARSAYCETTGTL